MKKVGHTKQMKPNFVNLDFMLVLCHLIVLITIQ